MNLDLRMQLLVKETYFLSCFGFYQRSLRDNFNGKGFALVLLQISWNRFRILNLVAFCKSSLNVRSKLPFLRTFLVCILSCEQCHLQRS